MTDATDHLVNALADAGLPVTNREDEPLPEHVRLLEAQAEDFARDVEDKALGYTVHATYLSGRSGILNGKYERREFAADDAAFLQRSHPQNTYGVCALVPVKP